MVRWALAGVNTLTYGAEVPSHLTPEDWIVAAFRRLGQGGISVVRAEVIARDLGVSKGSFYWHFRDLDDLKIRMLEHWRQQATSRIVAMAEAGGGTPALRLQRLLDLATSDLDMPYGGYSSEAAIRDWARCDTRAADAQAAADAERLSYLQLLFLESGLPRGRAARAARLLLMAYTGAVHMGVPDRAGLAKDLRHLLSRLLE
jgi:AcrR family transcriptional regulator